MRVDYFCRINMPEDEGRFRSSLHIGPAYKKVFGVSQAIVAAGGSVNIVTAPVVRDFRWRLNIGRKYTNTAGFTLSSFTVVGFPPIDRLLAAAYFLRFALGSHRKQRTVLLYNFFPEYILAALVLRLFGRPAVLDIEDAPRKDEKGIRGFFTRWSFSVLRILCDRKKLVTVSQSIGLMVGAKRPLVVYGVAQENFDSLAFERKWSEPRELRILYGGSLMLETGIDIFVNALRLLATAPRPARGISVYVTGFGSEDKIKALQHELSGHPFLDINIAQDLSVQRYEDLLKTMHSSLCLKVPGTGIGDTTFPSKVVEITANGLLLISTDVSDVPNIFDSSNAIILQANYGESLAHAILRVANDLAAYKIVALAGHALASQKFGQAAVGGAVCSYLSARLSK